MVTKLQSPIPKRERCIGRQTRSILEARLFKRHLGNGVITNRAYDAVTGWVGSIQSGLSGGTGLQNNSFTFDYLGDVTQRQDNNQGLTENFFYDADLRLDHSTPGGTINLQMAYDTTGMGNIASRSDVAGGTAWTYDSVRKHAVTQAGTGGYSYTYDGNGNVATRNEYAIDWTSYNYPSFVSSAGESVNFWYGPDRQRWKSQYVGSIGTEHTYHVSKLMEKVSLGGNLDYRHYIFAGNEQVAIVSRQSSGTNAVYYMLGAHQSSYSAIVTSAGALNVSESFTAYGNRRSGETWSGPPTSGDETAINAVSRQGYTDQTALGLSMGLNHMNGRVQDAITGRFLSADTYVPDPGDTQSFNRYSYVNNNPLSRIDPSGFDDDPLDEIVVVAQPIYDFAVDLFTGFGIGGGAKAVSLRPKAFNSAPFGCPEYQRNNFTDYPVWNPFIVKVEGTVAPGNKVHVTVKPVGKDPLSGDTLVTSLSDTRLAWTGGLSFPGLFKSKHEFIVEDLGANKTMFYQNEKMSGIVILFANIKPEAEGFVLMNEELKKRAERTTQSAR